MKKLPSIVTPWRGVCLAAHLWTTPAVSQVTDSITRTQAPSGDLRANIGATLLIAVLGGALGAFAADLVTDGGRIDRWKRDESGWTLGVLGKLIVGSVAALIMSSVNPAEMWWELAGTTLGAGVGAEAILLAIIAARKAESAEAARDQAEAHARNIAEFAEQRLSALKSIAAGEANTSVGLPVAPGTLNGSGAESDRANGSEALAIVADRFRAEVAAFAMASVPAIGDGKDAITHSPAASHGLFGSRG